MAISTKGMTETFLKDLEKFIVNHPSLKDGYVYDSVKQVKVRVKQLDQFTFKKDEYFNVQFKGSSVIAIGDNGDNILIIILFQFLLALCLDSQGDIIKPLHDGPALKKKCSQHVTSKKLYLFRDGKRIPEKIYPVALERAGAKYDKAVEARRLQYMEERQEYAEARIEDLEEITEKR
ncbi:MAG: hypothetical protein SGILL_008555, partial [Bacillariaceae sp.]